MKKPPLSLYVHLPWCVRKCPYCDFNSHKAGEHAPKQRYINALLSDLATEANASDGRALCSVFLGGGTPSLFSPQEIEMVLNGVRHHFALVDDIEITMEANPGTVECGSPAGYRQAGVTRLSIGAQSFNDRLLGVLGRIHSSADIVRAVNDAKAAGFDNLNIDVMHGLPGQSSDEAMADLNAAVALSPSHISWYQLTLEPNTIFYARPPAGLPDDDLAYEIQDRGQALLASHGYQQYEVSAYARAQQVCRHNLNYWQFGDYLAVGAGAHGKITTSAGVARYQKPANPLQYMQTIENGEAQAARSVVASHDLLFEFMLNALRLSEGFQEQTCLERTGLQLSELLTASEAARNKGLIERDAGGHWRATALGGRFLNDLQSEFMVDGA